MENLRQKIKELADMQPQLKNQRKTIKLEGERTIEPRIATYQHYSNRDTLRHLYMAYGLLRGKRQQEIEYSVKTPIDMDYVNELVKQYKPVEDGE